MVSQIIWKELSNFHAAYLKVDAKRCNGQDFDGLGRSHHQVLDSLGIPGEMNAKGSTPWVGGVRGNSLPGLTSELTVELQMGQIGPATGINPRWQVLWETNILGTCDEAYPGADEQARYQGYVVRHAESCHHGPMAGDTGHSSLLCYKRNHYHFLPSLWAFTHQNILRQKVHLPLYIHSQPSYKT